MTGLASTLGYACTALGQVLGIAVLFAVGLLLVSDILAHIRQIAQDRRIDAEYARDRAKHELALEKLKHPVSQPAQPE